MNQIYKDSSYTRTCTRTCTHTYTHTNTQTLRNTADGYIRNTHTSCEHVCVCVCVHACVCVLGCWPQHLVHITRLMNELPERVGWVPLFLRWEIHPSWISQTNGVLLGPSCTSQTMCPLRTQANTQQTNMIRCNRAPEQPRLVG